MSLLPHPDRKQLIERAGGDFSLTRQAQLLSISRANLYYQPASGQRDLAAMNALDAIYTAYPFYGSRRMQYELNTSYKINICREHIQRLMRLMGLEAIYPKKRQGLSKPNSQRQTYPYLLKNITAGYANHIWGADITYVRLENGWAYLVALLDWFSRYVVAWQLSKSLEVEFCSDNLKKALQLNRPLIHNSDQGSHFTSPRYTDLLTMINAQISMDGRGRYMDNIFTERLWRTVKYENIYLKSYANIDEAQTGLTDYFRFYNTKRPHQSLANRTPAQLYFKS